MRATAQLLAWVISMIYAAVPVFWFFIHPLTGFWRRRKHSYLYILPAHGAIIALGLVLTWPWRRVTLYDTPWSWLVTLACVGGAMFLFRGVKGHFTNQQMVGRNELDPEHFEQRLVTTGPHARVRHPIYVAHLLMLVGWTVGSGLLVCYALLGFALVTGTVMITLEERELEQRFGGQFREYRRRVPAIIPRLGS